MIEPDEYRLIKRRLCKGFNTFNTRSVLSHVLLPQAIAIDLGFKEYRGGGQLDEALIGRTGDGEEQVRPGPRSYDGSYTELTVLWRGLEVLVQTSVCDGDFLALVTPLAGQLVPASLLVRVGILWGRPGFSERQGDRLVVTAPGAEVVVHSTVRSVDEPHVKAMGPYLALRLDGPVGLSTGEARSLSAITAAIEAARAEHVRKADRFGEQAEAYTAMQTCLAWDTIYDPAKDRIISPVSRRWNTFQGGWVLFCWDTYFAAYMASVDSKDLAYANAIEITRERTERGFVPNVVNAHGFCSRDRSQPPVGSMVVREIYRKYRERWLVEMLFDALLEWNRWWWGARRSGELLTWGSDPYQPVCGNEWEYPERGVGGRFGAALESGLDNSPMYDSARFDASSSLLMLHDVGLNGLYAMDCRCLADLAGVLGRSEEASELEARASVVTKRFDDLWDGATGIYRNRHTDDGALSPHLSPTCFYAWLCDGISSERSQRMLNEHLFNEREFWGTYALPSIARNDPAFPEQSYWRGRIWAPMNFLVYQGLRFQRLESAAARLAEKSASLLLKEWRLHGHVCEHYEADLGVGETAAGAHSADRFYHWGGLLGLIALIDAKHVPGWEQPLD